MRIRIWSWLFAAIFLGGCIGDDIVDDFVPPAVKIMNTVDTLALGSTWQFDAKYTNNIGKEETLPVQWASSNEDVLAIDGSGLATGLAKGSVTLTTKVEAGGEMLSDQWPVVVGDETVVSSGTQSGKIVSTSSYLLEGNFEISEEGNGIKIFISDGYRASTALPGLYIYLGNNKSSISGNGTKEIQMVQVYSGAHSYQVDGVGLNDFKYILYWCKPFNVKVGEGVVE